MNNFLARLKTQLMHDYFSKRTFEKMPKCLQDLVTLRSGLSRGRRSTSSPARRCLIGEKSVVFKLDHNKSVSNHKIPSAC